MVFYLICYGICRRQVLWISKQILQLVMEDAIDEWIIRQINWLRRDDVIVQGIRWIQDVRRHTIFIFPFNRLFSIFFQFYFKMLFFCDALGHY